ncbi:hypothetical protein MTR67_042942 [Solanum verrucosum]|uniref:Uncharacterized protein n=1 Tax=Solanum verrucosum TaxID=315347 RepID=A0AAF0UNS1_SOLVR|nr:hypothetical protein MTR67_042942 [Solanum verrucosum]
MKKSTHFLPVKTSFSSEDYPMLYVTKMTDGQAEHTIQILEDMLRSCVIYFKGNWDHHLHMIEFAYNNSYHSSPRMAPFEALYCRRCRSPFGWFEVGEFANPNL